MSSKYLDYIKNNDSCKRLNDSIYKTKFKGQKFIIKDYDLTKSSTFYESIREVAILLKLNHKNIIKVVDYFFRDDKMYVVMPYYSQSLYNVICDYRKKNKSFSHEQIKKIMNGILDGLHYIHENDICHRDLKPDNIMLTDDGTPIIIDFGQCKKLTLKNTTQLGTCYYRPPEISAFSKNKYSKIYDKKVDSWGLGCILFELFTGKQLTSLIYDVDYESETKTDDEDDVLNDDDETEEETDETDEETDEETQSESSDDDVEILTDLFNKLGVPDNEFLTKFKLKHIVKSDMSKTKKPIDYFKTMMSEDKADLLSKLIAYNPESRYSMKDCYSHSMIRKTVPKVTKLHQSDTSIPMNNANFNMLDYQNQYKKFYKMMKDDAMSDVPLKKGKKLGLLYLSRYKHKVPSSMLIKLIGVCVYICDNLVCNGDLHKDDCSEYLSMSNGKFTKILSDVMSKTIEDVYLL